MEYHVSQGQGALSTFFRCHGQCPSERAFYLFNIQYCNCIKVWRNMPKNIETISIIFFLLKKETNQSMFRPQGLVQQHIALMQYDV